MSRLKIILSGILIFTFFFESNLFYINKVKAFCGTPNAAGLGITPNPTSPNQPLTLTASGSGGDTWHFDLNGADIYDGHSNTFIYSPGISSTSTFGAYFSNTSAQCPDDSNTVSRTVTVQQPPPPPTTGTIAVTSNNAAATWSFPSSAGNPCGTCLGTGQTYSNQPLGTYNFSAGNIYATTVAPSSSATGGSTCSSSTQCNLTANGQVNYTANYTNTTCTVTVSGRLNPTNAVVAATNQSYTISGPANASATNSTANQTYTLPADSSGTNYNFVVNNPANGVTVDGYVSDYIGVNNPSQSCTPGGSILFTINYQSRPVLQVQ